MMVTQDRGHSLLLGEPLGMEPAAGLVKLAARRPARECMLGDRPYCLRGIRTASLVACPALLRGVLTRFPALHDSGRGIKQLL